MVDQLYIDDPNGKIQIQQKISIDEWTKKIMIFMHTIKNNIARKTLEGKYVNLEGITFNEIAE